MPPCRRLLLCLLLVLLPGALLRAQTHSSFLLFGREDLPGMQSRLGSPRGLQLRQRLDSLCSRPSFNLPLWQQANQAEAFAFRYLLLGNDSDATAALELSDGCLDALESPPTSNRLPEALPLGVARDSTLCALALCFDMAHQAWPIARRHQIAERLLLQAHKRSGELKLEQRHPELGIPALLDLAAIGLCADALTQEDSTSELAQGLSQRSQQLLEAQLRLLPAQSWLADGFVTLRQALSHGLGSYLWHLERNGRSALIQPLAKHLSSLYITALRPPAHPGSAPGAVLTGLPPLPPTGSNEQDWAGAANCSGDTALLLCLGDAVTHDALLWTFDRCFDAPLSYGLDVRKGGDLIPTLLGACTDYPSVHPGKLLPLNWLDEASGTVLTRNRWQDHDDIQFALTANAASSPSSNGFADAGSFQLEGLGEQWITRRASERGEADASRLNENVIFIPGTNGWTSGRLQRYRLHADGSLSALLNLDRCYEVAPAPTEKGSRARDTADLGIRVTRRIALDFSGMDGIAALLLIDDEIRNGPASRWRLHTRQKDIRILPAGFELRAESGAVLHATILSPQAPRISVQQGPATSTITLDGGEHYQLVLTLCPPKVPPPRVSVAPDGSLHVGHAILNLDEAGASIR